MSQADNVAVVQQFYRAIHRGDTRAVLSVLADDVEWHQPGPAETLPWAGMCRGREQVAQCLAALDEASEVQQLELWDFIAQDNRVVVAGRERTRIKRTGHVYESPWAMVFTVRGGKITYFRAHHDTAAIVAAMVG